jgi:hypothetical protein
MFAWQVDVSRRPIETSASPTAEPQAVWELLICTEAGERLVRAAIPQAGVNREWLRSMLEAALATYPRPQALQVFRPQCLGLIQVAAADLQLRTEAKRRTESLQDWLRELSGPAGSGQELSTITQLPPQPVPEGVMAERWKFAAVPAEDVLGLWRDRPIPIVEAPTALLPLSLGLASTELVPGVMMEGGRRSMALARWLLQRQPYRLQFVVGEPDGLILEAGLDDRWVLATAVDPEVRQAGERFGQRMVAAKGLHFLVIAPDDSEMTTSGVWLLQG